jgi:hypothetical protein
MNLKDKQRCNYPGCSAQAVLKEMIPDPLGLPRMVSAGSQFPQPQRLRAWVCEMNPKRHVEVVGWGFRPTKACSVPGCDGVMIHSDKARVTAPDDIRKLPGKPYSRVFQHAGYLCMKNESHVELETVETV